jgi:hypothetical protein
MFPTAAGILRELRLPATDAHDLPSSPFTFPDGAQYRVEIPSTEGPECLAAVFEMARLAAARHAEISLFARPMAGWGTSAMALAPAGAVAAGTVHGTGQLAAALDDVCRAAAHGFRSVLVSDIGLLAIFGQARDRDLLARSGVTAVTHLPSASTGLAVPQPTTGN